MMDMDPALVQSFGFTEEHILDRKRQITVPTGRLIQKGDDREKRTIQKQRMNTRFGFLGSRFTGQFSPDKNIVLSFVYTLNGFEAWP
ncbi:hypothetical protein P4V43_03670 [Brevibacillus fortis]|nr:hypothetical protein [Brevibacillus fortis]